LTDYREIGPGEMPGVMDALRDWFVTQGIDVSDGSEVCVHMLASLLAYTISTADDAEDRTEKCLRLAIGVAQKELKFLALEYFKMEPEK